MNDATHLWEYIPVSDFDVPSAPATEVAHGGVMQLLKSFRGIFNSSGKKAESEKPQWDRLSDDLLASILPDLD